MQWLIPSITVMTATRGITIARFGSVEWFRWIETFSRGNISWIFVSLILKKVFLCVIVLIEGVRVSSEPTPSSPIVRYRSLWYHPISKGSEPEVHSLNWNLSETYRLQIRHPSPFQHLNFPAMAVVQKWISSSTLFISGWSDPPNMPSIYIQYI